jgi:hypothetical protein
MRVAARPTRATAWSACRSPLIRPEASTSATAATAGKQVHGLMPSRPPTVNDDAGREIGESQELTDCRPGTCSGVIAVIRGTAWPVRSRAPRCRSVGRLREPQRPCSAGLRLSISSISQVSEGPSEAPELLRMQQAASPNVTAPRTFALPARAHASPRRRSRVARFVKVQHSGRRRRGPLLFESPSGAA